MKENSIKKKLAAGKPSIGLWHSLCSPLAAEYMAHVGWDWMVVDTEHSPVGFETMVHCFQAITTTDTLPMARVAGNDPILIKRLLDAGAMGLVIPMVNSRAEALQAAEACRFPPEGRRSLGGGRALIYGSDYFQRANDEILVVVQIEHIDAVRAARDILSVEGIDACFVGPNDLAGSMGITPATTPVHPDHAAAIMEVLAAAREVGKPAGIHCADAEQVNLRIDQGFQFIACANDAAMMRAAATEAWKKIRSHIETKTKPT
ncbi:MAG: 2-dehydro-3-deoxyglucarate aldolase [Armatimonadetes bacterium]|nr:2-dehydro-3-deoxyglucarate aldolase [Armatimonadota bacterium]